MSLRFYIDDSGKNDPPVFVLGGVALDVGRLEEFEAAWRSALANPPAIPFFKMKDANARQGVFKGMSPADRDAKVAALGEVLRIYAVASISVVVRHDQYRRTYKGRLMRWMDEPYQMLFHLIIATAYKLVIEKDLGSTAEFVFDRQLNEERTLEESLATFRQGLVEELASFLAADPRHADDKDEVGLQAADMVAWHVRRSWRVRGVPFLFDETAAMAALAPETRQSETGPSAAGLLMGRPADQQCASMAVISGSIQISRKRTPKR